MGECKRFCCGALIDNDIENPFFINQLLTVISN
jgi:hypothetical protein